MTLYTCCVHFFFVCPRRAAPSLLLLTRCKSDCVQALAKDKELAERKLYNLGSPSERKVWNSLDCPGMIFFVRTILCVLRLSDFWAIPPSLKVIFLVLALFAVLHLARVLLRATPHTLLMTPHILLQICILWVQEAMSLTSVFRLP
jgi:hypothetical protein